MMGETEWPMLKPSSVYALRIFTPIWVTPLDALGFLAHKFAARSRLRRRWRRNGWR